MSTHVNDPNEAIESAQNESTTLEAQPVRQLASEPSSEPSSELSSEPSSELSGKPVGDPEVVPTSGVVTVLAEQAGKAQKASSVDKAAQEANSREARVRLITEAVKGANASDVRAAANIVYALVQADPACTNLIIDSALQAKLDALVARVRLSHPALFRAVPEVSPLSSSMSAAATPSESARAQLAMVESRARATNDRRALLEYLRARRGAVALR